MIRQILVTTAVMVLSGSADADPFNKTVPAGQTTNVKTYKPWGQSCVSGRAVATLISKPQHGRVSHYLTATSFGAGGRFRQPSGGCYGRPTTGFVVTYTPDAGFHGVDHFTLDVEFSEMGKHVLDAFAIVVE